MFAEYLESRLPIVAEHWGGSRLSMAQTIIPTLVVSVLQKNKSHSGLRPYDKTKVPRDEDIRALDRNKTTNRHIRVHETKSC